MSGVWARFLLTMSRHIPFHPLQPWQFHPLQPWQNQFWCRNSDFVWPSVPQSFCQWLYFGKSAVSGNNNVKLYLSTSKHIWSSNICIETITVMEKDVLTRECNLLTHDNNWNNIIGIFKSESILRRKMQTFCLLCCYHIFYV